MSENPELAETGVTLVIAHEIGQVSDTLERAGIESDPAGALPVFATVEASTASVRTR